MPLIEARPQGLRISERVGEPRRELAVATVERVGDACWWHIIVAFKICAALLNISFATVSNFLRFQVEFVHHLG